MGVGSRKQRSCLANLPDEHLYLIFEKQDSNHDRESFGLTCHSFLDIQNSSLKHLELGNFYSRRIEIDSLMLDKLLNRFRHLESLSLTGCDHVTDSGLVLLQKYGVKLRSLHLDYCPQITNVGFSSIASGCPSLLVISLFHRSIEDSGLEILAESCNSLKEVSLVWCDEISDWGIQSLIHNCPQLRALRITGCRIFNGKGFKGCSSTLACLEANNCCALFMGLADVVSGGGLEYLNLGNMWHKNINGHALAAIGSGLAANLKFLNILGGGGGVVKDDAIIIISKGCQLQEWNLAFCEILHSLDGSRLDCIVKSLERIHVSSCLIL